MEINSEIMDILKKLQPIEPDVEANCPMCRKKVWVCEAGRAPNECAGKIARRVLAKMGE
jgi:hypothetical protein